MNPLRGVLTAFQSLWDYKGRSALALLGMLISALLIVFLTSVLFNFKSALSGQLNSIGLKEIVAVPGRVLNNHVNRTDISSLMSFTSMNSTLTVQDALNVKKQVPHVVAAAPQTETVTTATTPTKSAEVIYTGTLPDFAKVFRIDMAQGRFLNERDVKNEAQSIVLGATIKQELFGNQPAVGKKITIKGVPFTVVGVIQKKELVGFDFNERAYTEYQMLTDTANVSKASMVFFGIDSRSNIMAANDQIANVITADHGGVHDFTLVKPDQALQILSVLTKLVTAITVGIASVSVLVGGIGIMNVMLLVVNERTREIGLRKAVGAKSVHVLMQFLMESATISLVGSAAGIAIAYALLRLLHHLYAALPDVMPQFLITGSLGFSIAIGLIFGLIPAFKAVRIQPVDALRYE